MVLSVRLVIVGAVGIGAGIPSAAQVAPGQDSVIRNNGTLNVRWVQDFPEGGMATQLAGNSREANLREWPASFYEEAGGERCSATLIGPQTVLTAAHCVGNNKQLKVIQASGAPMTGICHHPDAYDTGADLSADYALCLMQVPVAASRYETVSTDARMLQKGSLMLTTGYGCVIPEKPVLSNKMAIGPMWIGEIAGFYTESASVVASDGDHANTAFLCKGDSGGAAYIGDEDGARVVVAVNAWVDNDTHVSYLAALSTPVAVAFLNDWIKPNDTNIPAKGHEICGLSGNLAHCRDTP